MRKGFLFALILFVASLWGVDLSGSEGFQERSRESLNDILRKYEYVKGKKISPVRSYNVAKDNFIEGLSLLIEGKEEEGLRKLKKASAFPAAHIALGTYYEEKGHLKLMEREYRSYLADTKRQREMGDFESAAYYEMILEKFKRYGISYKEFSFAWLESIFVWVVAVGSVGLFLVVLTTPREDILDAMKRRLRGFF